MGRGLYDNFTAVKKGIMQTKERSSRLVATWLLIGVGMTVIQIALGGITRLTGSGLSITQWDVITGSLPPMKEADWILQFEKYRQTPQFQILNFDFTLSDFKFIFFWEWFHRLWARSIGMVFVIGFVWLLVKKHFRSEMIQPLIALFFLGALQGAIGWIMVASGLTGDAVYVNPAKISLHFIFALGLLCYTFWFALQLLIPNAQRIKNSSLRTWNIGILLLLVLQLLYGALMAGHKAANTAPTWPTINGSWVPGKLFTEQTVFLNLINNKILIHFIHRSLAYLLLVLILLWSVRLKSVIGTNIFNRAKFFPLLIVLFQVILGIATVLSSTGIVPGHWGMFEWMAQLHQLTGMLLLLSLIGTLYIIRKD